MSSLDDESPPANLYNPNGINNPSQNIEEFNEELTEGFFDEDEMIEEVKSQDGHFQNHQKENIDIGTFNAKEAKSKCPENPNRGFVDESKHTAVSSGPTFNINDDNFWCKDQDMSVPGDIQVDSGTLPT